MVTRELDLPMDDYHARPQWSRSQIMDYIASPELFRGRYVDCDIPRIEETPAMARGTLVDAYLTEGRHLPTDDPPDAWAIATADDVSKSGAKAGTKWKDFEAANPDKICKSPKDLDKFKEERQDQREMLKAIGQQCDEHEMARRFLRDPDVVWQPSYFDEDVRCRPDLVVPGVAVVDIKCMGDISKESVARSAIKFGYDVQGALCQIMHDTYEDEILPFVLLCIHSQAPYEVETYQLTDEFIDHGAARAWTALELINDKQWRSNTHGHVTVINLPAWLRPRDEASAPIEQQVY